MDTLENLHRKIGSANELQSVVKTMKAMAAGNVTQFETATGALKEYFENVERCMKALLMQGDAPYEPDADRKPEAENVLMLVFGSDQGLVGRFNEVLSDYAVKSDLPASANKIIWAVGERVAGQLRENKRKVEKVFTVPGSVSAITALVGQILIEMETLREGEGISEFHIVHHHPLDGAHYEPVQLRLLPVDEEWLQTLRGVKWPGNKTPQLMGRREDIFSALIREYIFVSLYKACAESLASENTSRLNAMQRAEKNIDDILNDLNAAYHRLRQTSIDEELFDVVSGYEAFRINKEKN